VEVLAQIDEWNSPAATAAMLGTRGVIASRGDSEAISRWASVSKLLVAYAVLIAAEEGSVDLDEPAGPPGSTLRHLLAHASGLALNSHAHLAKPGKRRIYSNTDIEVAATHLAEATEMPFARYLQAELMNPLGMSGELRGSPAIGYQGSLDDLILFAGELLTPRLVTPEKLREATTVQFPGLGGVLPGIGRFEPNDWGLGFELRGKKHPHWTGTTNSPRTFGHFGGSGAFLWVDPERGVALACLSGRDFGPWALEAWPTLSDAVLAELA
jgi:CubicO group peptidase (beta-lactamase class C family)